MRRSVSWYCRYALCAGLALPAAKVFAQTGAGVPRVRRRGSPSRPKCPLSANSSGKPIPGLAPAEQHVRSCAIVLPREQHFREHARHGLFAPLDADPLTV